MTGNELLKKKVTRYLFTQNGYDFYEVGDRFFKVPEFDFDSQAIPVDINEDEDLNNYYS